MYSKFLRATRYVKCYGDLLRGKPRTAEETIDYCAAGPIMMAQVRTEIAEFAKLLATAAPRLSLEIGTRFGGTLLLLCRVSPPGAKIISMDLPSQPSLGLGYPRNKIPLYRRFPKAEQRLYLLRADSHLQSTKQHVERILKNELLDYAFIDGDHSYEGVRRDFEMYSTLVRSGGMIAFHDIAVHGSGTWNVGVSKFWSEIKQNYNHQEIVADASNGSIPLATNGAPMESSGIGVLFVR